MEDERTLLEKLARGDRASFDALYMRYAAKTEEFLCRMPCSRTGQRPRTSPTTCS